MSFVYPRQELRNLDRRSFIFGAASFAAAALWSSRALGAVTRLPRFSAYPFQLGIASGDPAPDGFVIWTRLAPDPLNDGGMTAESVEVSWQVSEDEQMTRVVKKGTTVANADWAHSVHVEVEGLKPDRWYWYQFKAGGEVSPKSRSRTLPPPGSLPDRLRFAAASCQHYSMGYYTAFDHMAREDLDLIVHLGDYIYEGGLKAPGPRIHNGPEIKTLAEYRNRYALYKSDPALQAAHVMAPWIVTWDDHEVSNNYAAAIAEREDVTVDQFLLRRAAGYQAFYEHQPLRRSALPRGPDMLLYRDLSFGRLASFNVLDTRQYRTDQPCGDGTKPPCDAVMDPKATILGERQRSWLFNNLERSSAAWNVLAQQVPVARIDYKAGPEVALSVDKWAGYEVERRRLLRHFRDRKTSNPVVLTGDVHTNWANELTTDFDQPDSKPVATEFITTSLTSGGDGVDRRPNHDLIMSENPFVKYYNSQRGYLRCEITPETWRTDYRVVPYVERPHAPITTPVSFIVESGRPVLNQA